MHRQIFKSTQQVIITFDTNGIIVFFNKKAEQLFQYNAEEIINKESIQILSKSDFKINESNNTTHYETILYTKRNTPIALNISVSPVFNSKGKISAYTLVAYDILKENVIETKIHQEINRINPIRFKDDFIIDRKLSILLVEDYKINQLLAQTILSKFNMMVTTVENGQLAIDALKKADFDIVLMNLMMPVMNGYEASKHIRTKLNAPKRTIPIIAISADITNSVIKKCKDCGMNDYISNPYKEIDLINKILNWVNE